MKAVKWFAPRDMRVVDVAQPVPEPHEALIRIESTGVCGSDMHYFAEGRIGQTAITEPLILGHEYAGIVEAVGGAADDSLVGKRVAVEPGIPCLNCEWCHSGHYNVCPDMVFPGGPPYDGALCEYKTVHARFCFPVPDGISAAEAAMLEPLAVAVHTVELARLKPGETAAILGLGPIGLLVAQVARAAGVGLLFGTDLLDYRVAAGAKYGVDEAFNASREDTVETILSRTNGRGVDVAFDCARSSATPSLACRVVRPAGRFAYAGEGWGIACDGARLVMSDGTATLRRLDPRTFRPLGRVTVTDRGRPVANLNELEFVKGELFANVWGTDAIARISPETGRVLGWIDLRGLSGMLGSDAPVDVLNGIAYDRRGDRLFVTGKFWPKLFEIRLVRK